MHKNSTLISKMNWQKMHLNQLYELDTKLLKILFKQIFDNHSRSRTGVDFLTGNIAWAIQADLIGLDHNKIRKKLTNQAKRKSISHKTQYLPGTRLVREWNGETHEVVVEENGFLWKGNFYKSLSEIAREITGSRWSGPRFFGISK